MSHNIIRIKHKMKKNNASKPKKDAVKSDTIKLGELEADKGLFEDIKLILFNKQKGLCDFCGDDLDEETKVFAVKCDIKTIDDLRLVCSGSCEEQK